MIARAGSGWQTVLADLSLILFMITAAAASELPTSPVSKPDVPVLPALGEPVAVWRAGPDAPSLPAWLASSGLDPRLRLTILAAPEQAQMALALAAGAGRPARILLEPQAGVPCAMLTYDQENIR